MFNFEDVYSVTFSVRSFHSSSNKVGKMVNDRKIISELYFTPSKMKFILISYRIVIATNKIISPKNTGKLQFILRNIGLGMKPLI